MKEINDTLVIGIMTVPNQECFVLGRNMLFLHTPLTIVEHHGHAAKSVLSAAEDFPCKTDAALNEGRLDLNVRNKADNTW